MEDLADMNDTDGPTYPVNDALRADLVNRFCYHSPNPGQPARYTTLRDHAGDLAEHICEEVPESRERALALTKLEEAVMWANAGIARNE